jgi:Protein of unknown function (DUF3071)
VTPSRGIRHVGTAGGAEGTLMQELRLVAVSEDGSYAVLTAPGRSGRFSLPIDERLRIVARGQFSRLAQYEIEVESPLRPKEIQDRIRAGETAEEIADVAGVPLERVRRFEGPVLAERAYRAQEAQGASVRHPGESGPGRRLGEVVAERLTSLGADIDDAEWDSRKRTDGTWLVSLVFRAEDHPRLAEWVFDPRSRHVSPADDTAAGLCLAEAGLPPVASRQPRSATVTPIGSRLSPAPAEHDAHSHPEPVPVPTPSHQGAAEDGNGEASGVQPAPGRERPARKAAGGRSRRSSVPSWDEIMFGTSRQPD